MPNIYATFLWITIGNIRRAFYPCIGCFYKLDSTLRACATLKQSTDGTWKFSWHEQSEKLPLSLCNACSAQIENVKRTILADLPGGTEKIE